MRSAPPMILFLALVGPLFAVSSVAFPMTRSEPGGNPASSKEHTIVTRSAPISSKHHIPPWTQSSAGCRHPPCTTKSLEPTAKGADFLRGVNIGGWLVLEPMTTPELFAETGAVDQWTFDQTQNASFMLTDHWENFFKEEDVAKMATYGVNALRIPIGFWAYDNDDTPYIKGADTYLDRATEWARLHSMKVWIDLHCAPGSQNGLDHSGHLGDANWQQPNNLERTISILKTIAWKYGTPEYADVIVAIELINEPISGPTIHFDVTKTWAARAYTEVRKALVNKNVHIVMDDAFMHPVAWINTIESTLADLNDHPADHRADFALDTHLYQLFTAADLALTQQEHIDKACKWSYDFLPATNAHVPVYVGEWSGVTDICVHADGATTAGRTCATPGCQCEAGTSSEEWNDLMVEQVRRYVEAQLDVYEKYTTGYFYWNFKAQDAWGFMAGVEKGFIPNPLPSRIYPGQCDWIWT